MLNKPAINILTFLIVFFYQGFPPLSSQILIKTGVSSVEMIQDVLLNDTSGIKIEEVTYTGSVKSVGVFTSATQFLPITKGLVLSTGFVENVDGPNESGDMGSICSTSGDKDLDRIAKRNTADAAVLEFTFYPNTDEISFEYFFASEEYPEYINHGVNDVFAFFIKGMGYEKPENIANLPTTGEPITVDHINPSKNPMFYMPNKPWNGAPTQGTQKEMELAYSFEFDGMTQLLVAKAKVVPYQPYHLKLAIADVGDNIYDSGVLIRANSLKSRGESIPFVEMIESDLINTLKQSEFIIYKIENNQVHLQSTIQFSFNSNSLQKEYKDALDNLVGLLNQYFDIQLHLVGHTDNIGTAEYNRELSLARAQAIKDYLTQNKIENQRISVDGKGNLEPWMKEDTNEAQALNRRVEFILYRIH